MTPFLSIGETTTALAGTDLHELKVFYKPVDQITTVDMAVLTKQCELKLGRQRGKALMKRLLGELTRARLLGDIPKCPASIYTLPSPRLTLGEFRRLLAKFNQDERRLVVVALASGHGLTECSFFQHQEIKKIANINNWSAELRRFVQMIPRHISSPYVFWSNDKTGRPVPMIGFEVKFRQVTKASWQTFASLCGDLIPMDSEEDAKEFATMFVLESANLG